MRGAAMGFGILLVVMLACLMELIGGSRSAIYIGGAALGFIGCSAYGLALYNRVTSHRIGGGSRATGRPKKF